MGSPLHTLILEPTPLGDRNPLEIDDYFILSKCPELQIFDYFSFEKENSYFDLKKAAKELGHDLKDLYHENISFDIEKFTYINKKHPLYVAYIWLEKFWHRTYRSSIQSFEESEYYKFFKISFLEEFKKCGWEEDYVFFTNSDYSHPTSRGINTGYFNLVNAHNFATNAVKVEIINPPIYKKIEKCITYDEIVDYKRGANKQFFRDKICYKQPFVMDQKTLIEHWGMYFSGKNDNFRVDSDRYSQEMIPDVDLKKNFKEKIVDKFIDGIHFIAYC